MTNEEKILETLEEMKTALRALYSDARNQDSLIHTIGKGIKSEIGGDLDKMQRQINDLQEKLSLLPKLLDLVNKLTRAIDDARIDELKGDHVYIRSSYASIQSKLSSIDSKLR